MAELTEEQLLLLDNLMYFDGSGERNCTVGTIAEKLKEKTQNYNKSTLALSGGFEDNPKQAEEIAKAVLSDKTLCKLYVEDSVNTKTLRASCFVDSDGEATVAIRGTGGSYEAWSDNLKGAYDPETEIQDEMLNFIEKQGIKYDNITVTGHSKGGNLAQYVTIKSGENVDRCVSFDGQGFNDEFVHKYSDEIAENKSKIKSICGNEDYVNILLTSVAGETVYLKTLESENPHSSYALWEANRGKMKDGKYTDMVEQSENMQKLNFAADEIVRYINHEPDYWEEPFVDFWSSVVGTVIAIKSKQYTLDNLKDTLGNINRFSIAGSIADVDLISKLRRIEFSWNNMKDPIRNAFDEFIKTHTSQNDELESIKNIFSFIEDIYDKHMKVELKDTLESYITNSKKADFAVDYDKLKDYASILKDYSKNIDSIIRELDSINILDDQYLGVRKSIEKMQDKIKEQKKVLEGMGDVLYDASNLYCNTEKALLC